MAILNCIKSGDHDLEIIMRRGSLVVRWCKDCGAVVIDEEYDRRIYPGEIMPMKYPKITEDYNIDEKYKSN